MRLDDTNPSLVEDVDYVNSIWRMLWIQQGLFENTSIVKLEQQQHPWEGKVRKHGLFRHHLRLCGSLDTNR
jgi:hypothetical protein